MPVLRDAVRGEFRVGASGISHDGADHLAGTVDGQGREGDSVTNVTTWTAQQERVVCWANTSESVRCKRDAVTVSGLCEACRDRLVNETEPEPVPVPGGYWWLA